MLSPVSLRQVKLLTEGVPGICQHFVPKKPAVLLGERTNRFFGTNCLFYLKPGGNLVKPGEISNFHQVGFGHLTKFSKTKKNNW